MQIINVIDDQTREIFNFWINGVYIRLNFYSKVRENGRDDSDVLEVYDTYDSSRSTLKREDVPLTPNIIEKVKTRYCNDLVIL